MTKTMIKLEDWCVTSPTANPYQAPEQGVPCLGGFCVGHPKHKDYTYVTTSAIKGVKGGGVETKSGSVYDLLKPAIEYEKQFPNAKVRLFISLNHKRYDGLVDD